jgi:hypothetical protein
MKKVLIPILIIILSIQAKPFMWWEESGPEPVEQPPEVMTATSGNRKALIIVSKFPEDTAVYLLPTYCDSLIAPNVDSITDFLKIV